MRLLLEHGGDPNLDVDSLTPLSWMDDELCIDPIWKRWCCDHLVQCLMVMQAYGVGGMEQMENSIDHFRCAKGTGPRSSRNLKSLIIGSEQKKVTSVRSISLRKQQEQSCRLHLSMNAPLPASRLCGCFRRKQAQTDQVSLLALSVKMQQRTAPQAVRCCSIIKNILPLKMPQSASGGH